MHRKINTRNEALEFARRARQNLEFIEQAAAAGPRDDRVHVVTQITLSLLGMVVFLKEKLLLDSIETMTLNRLTEDGWLTWLISRDQPRRPNDITDTLGKLIRHVRNAVAHGRISFTSDSPQPEEVSLLVEDKYNRDDPKPYFCAEITATDLKDFCLRFLNLIDSTIG